jgi:hypothetical protein
MNKAFFIAIAAYLLPSFPLGYAWHMTLFADNYHALNLFRNDVIIPMGLTSMLTQAVLFAWAYPRLFGGLPWLTGALHFGVVFGLLAWSYNTLPIAAKYQMSSVSDFFWLETAFNLAQFVLVSPLIALAYRGSKP